MTPRHGRKGGLPATDAVRSWCAWLGRRLPRAARLERAVGGVVGPAARSSLRSRRLDVEASLTAALCSRPRDAAARQGTCAAAVEAWDAAAASLLATCLVTHAASILRHELSLVGTMQQTACGVCGGPVFREVWEAAYGAPATLVVDACATCGSFDGAYGDERRLAFAFDGGLDPGRTSAVPVALPRDATAMVLRGRLVVDVRDASTGRSFLTDVLETAGDSAIVSVEAPATLGADLHTLRLAWVCGLDASMAWRRWPVAGLL